jgi:hypothetical protein
LQIADVLLEIGDTRHRFLHGSVARDTDFSR